jgi:hypothetical protein
MTANKIISNCKFCSVVSQLNGEDPIGTADSFDTLIVMEISQPWTEERLDNDPVLSRVHDFFHELDDRQIQVSVMAIAPDREYSTPGYARVIYYQRPAKLFAEYAKQEFMVPEEQLAELASALVLQPEKLGEFQTYCQPESLTRDMMVCTDGNVDVACARFGYPIYRQLRDRYTSSRLRVWRCSHFGGHQFAPTLIDLPNGRVWGHLKPEILPVLVEQRGNVRDLRSFYRGFAGLTKFEQIVEGEIWMQQGWEWVEYYKHGQVLAKDTENEEDVDWAEVRVEFTTPNGSVAGSYEARVECCGSVMTAENSGETIAPVKQYRVSRLVRVT